MLRKRERQLIRTPAKPQQLHQPWHADIAGFIDTPLAQARCRYAPGTGWAIGRWNWRDASGTELAQCRSGRNMGPDFPGALKAGALPWLRHRLNRT